MADLSTSDAGPAPDQLLRLIQALEDCRGFLASCATAPRVFARAPLDPPAFEGVRRLLAALAGALALAPFECCARRPADVNSLDLALSRYLAPAPALASVDPAAVPALLERWYAGRRRPAVQTVAAGNGGQLRIETWTSPDAPQDAPTVLLLPICGVPLAAMRPLLGELARGHTAVCWDSSLLSGADPMPAIDGDPILALAGEVADVMRACRLERVHLVGICVATAPALLAADMLGERVQSLSICHAAVKVGDEQPATAFEQQYNAMLAQVCGSEEQAREVYRTLLEPGFAMSVPTALAPFILDPYTRLSRLRRHALVHGAAAAFDARASAARIACPALVLTTGADRMVHPEQSRQLAALLGHARLHQLDDGNHLDVLLEGNAFLPLVSSFISQPNPPFTEG